MKNIFRLCPLLLALGLGASCSKTTEGKDKDRKAITAEKLEPYQCGSIARLHTYGGIFLASQPSPEDFEQAKQDGVKTVINLRHESEVADFNEREIVTGLGLQYVALPWSGPEELTDGIFDRSRELLSSAQRPILLHCASANRVGALWLPWRVLEGGLSYEEALAEARTVGLKNADFEKKAADYIQRKRGS